MTFVDIHQRFIETGRSTFGLLKTETMEADFMKQLQDAHVAAWNERDRTKRDELLQMIYAGNIRMYDPEFVLEGLTEVSDFISQLHGRDTEFLFSAAAPIASVHNGARLYGHIGTKENPAVLKSMDFFILEGGKVTHLYVFIDGPK